MDKLTNLLKKVSRLDRHDRTEELQHEAADHIASVGSQPPADVDSASWAPAPAGPPSAAPQAPAPHQTAEQDAQPARVQPAPARRLTAQERVAARQLQAQSR